MSKQHPHSSFGKMECDVIAGVSHPDAGLVDFLSSSRARGIQHGLAAQAPALKTEFPDLDDRERREKIPPLEEVEVASKLVF